MKRLNFYVATFFILLIFSCNNKTDNHSSTSVCISEKIDIDSLVGSAGILYSQLYSDVKYIPLETTSTSLIARITKMEILNDEKILVFDNMKGAVCLFGKDGKFLHQIGRKGNGHNEYTFIKDVAYDKFNDQIIIFDSAKNILMFFDIEGNLLSTLRLSCYPSVFSVVDKEHLCLYLNYSDDIEDSSTGHNLLIMDREGGICSKWLEYDRELQHFAPFCENVFFQSEDILYFKPPFSNTIYNVSKNDVTRSFCLDLGKDMITEDWFKGISGELEDPLSLISKGVFLYSFYESSDYLFWEVSNRGRLSLCLMNKNKNYEKLYVTYMGNDIFGFVSSLTPKTVKNNKCYYIMDSSKFTRLKERLEKNNGVCRVVRNGEAQDVTPTQAEMDLLYSINDGDNPVIQICTLK